MKKVDSYRLEVWEQEEGPSYVYLFSFNPSAEQLSQIIKEIFPSRSATEKIAESLLKMDKEEVLVDDKRLKFEEEFLINLYVED